MKTIIVIPTYNESENISRLFDSIFASLPEAEVLVVDDNSPDGTREIIESRIKTNEKIHLINRPGKMGLGTAYCEGFQWALKNDFEVIFEMDADFSHDPRVLPKFLETLQDYDFVIGSRYKTGWNVVNWPLRRLILSYGANLYTRIITGMPIYDATGGYKCFRASALAKIDFSTIHSNGYGFQIEMNYRLWKNKERYVEMPIIFVDRQNGVSKMNKRIIFEAVYLVWKLRFTRFKNKKRTP